MDTDMTPLVSVLLPVYNGEAYLAESIQSILDQTFANFELLILNDGSKDRSLEIIQGFKDSRIKVINNPQNLGLIATLNKGLVEARGQFVARMDADDKAFPERFKIQYEYLSGHPEVAVVGTWAQVIDKDGKFIKLHRNPLDHYAIMYELMFGNTITHPSIMMRKDVVISVGGYDKNWQHAEDYDLYSRLVHRHKLANIGQPLLYYRQHGTSVTGTDSSQEIIRENTYKIMKRNISYYVPIDDHDLWLITKVLTVRHPDSNLKYTDILEANRLHKKILREFITKEKPNGNQIILIQKLYRGHRSLMLKKYLIGKYRFICSYIK